MCAASPNVDRGKCNNFDKCKYVKPWKVFTCDSSRGRRLKRKAIMVRHPCKRSHCVFTEQIHFMGII